MDASRTNPEPDTDEDDAADETAVERPEDAPAGWAPPAKVRLSDILHTHEVVAGERYELDLGEPKLLPAEHPWWTPRGLARLDAWVDGPRGREPADLWLRDSPAPRPARPVPLVPPPKPELPPFEQLVERVAPAAPSAPEPEPEPPPAPLPVAPPQEPPNPEPVDPPGPTETPELQENPVQKEAPARDAGLDLTELASALRLWRALGPAAEPLLARLGGDDD